MSQARQQMTMRARVIRPVSVGKNGFGEPIPDSVPDVVHDSLPCLAWAPTDAREQMDTAAAAFDTIRLAVPAGTDINEGDTIETISNRQGLILFEGPIRITGVTRRASHFAVMALGAKPGGL